MATSINTASQLNRSLERERNSVGASLLALRRRVRDDIYQLSPRRQLLRHPGALIGAAAISGLVVGRLAGGILALAFGRR